MDIIRNCRRLASIATTCVLASALNVPVSGHTAGPLWKPERNIDIIVSASAGSGIDGTARQLQRLVREKQLIEVSSTVVNRPGGGGNVALAYLKQRSGDAHQVMLITTGLLANQILGRSNVSYTELTPLALLATEPVMLAVRAESPIRNAAELAERFRADAGSVTVAFAPALGNHNHLAAAQIVRSVGGDLKNMKVVVFNGSAEGITALVGGHVDVILTSGSVLLGHMKAGRVRILAVSAEQRAKGELAQVPTWKEAGVSSVSTTWRAVMGPPGLRPEQVRYWDDVFGRLTQLPEWQSYLDKGQVENSYLNSRDTRSMLDAQYATLSKIMRELGLAK